MRSATWMTDQASRMIFPYSGDSQAQRIQAGTHSEKLAEQKPLQKASFQLEGIVRACEFRAGQWRDGYLYSRLRNDPSPL